MINFIKIMTLAVLSVGLVACGGDSTPKTENLTENLAENTPIIETNSENAKNTENTENTAQDEKKGVKLAEYFDFNCGYCRTASKTMAKLRNDYGDDLEFELYHLNVYPKVRTPHRYAACAREQGDDKFLAFHDTYFLNFYGKTSTAKMDELSEKIGLDMDLMATCLESDRPDAQIAADSARARSFGARGTPFFLLNDSLSIPGLISEDQFRQAIDSLQ